MRRLTNVLIILGIVLLIIMTAAMTRIIDFAILSYQEIKNPHKFDQSGIYLIYIDHNNYQLMQVNTTPQWLYVVGSSSAELKPFLNKRIKVRGQERISKEQCIASKCHEIMPGVETIVIDIKEIKEIE